MTIRARVIAALANISVPVFFGGWYPARPGDMPPVAYITFTTMSTPSNHVDDVRVAWRHYIYITLWSTAPYQTQRTALFTAMETAGFDVSELRESTEETTNTNRCDMTWVFHEDVS